MKNNWFVGVLGMALLSGCATTGYKPVENMAQLKVSFADSKWDGKMVPSGEQCKWAGGNGSTPVLNVENIPADANAVIVEYSDRSYAPMNMGGHGKIGMWLNGAQTPVQIPSVAGETKDLPENLFIEQEHQGSRGKSGAYLPPCSGGMGNIYYATVKAVYKGKSEKEVSRLLGQEKIELGRH